MNRDIPSDSRFRFTFIRELIMNSSYRRLVLGLAILVLALPDPAAAQFGRLRDRVKERVEENIGRRADRAVDRTMSGELGPNGENVAGSPDAEPGEGAWTNYDFVPGDRPLFVTDFSEDAVGDFPRRLRFESGNLQVAESRGRRWLHTTDGGVLRIPLSETLPERFTVEFDFVPGSPTMMNRLELCADCGSTTQINWNGAGRFTTYSTGDVTAEGSAVSMVGQVTPVRVMVDGEYMKVYAGGARVVNIPGARFERGTEIRLHLSNGVDGGATMIGNISVMAGGRELYDALSESGRVATQGILFDTGSDRILPESTPTLLEITRMLQEHPELSLIIEGHTDGVGEAAANQTLSERRAAAVREYFVSQGVDADRLESRGFGASQPAASNDTPEGRQQNRRVELVRS